MASKNKYLHAVAASKLSTPIRIYAANTRIGLIMGALSIMRENPKAVT
jgi:hypothetical protein